MSKSFLAILLLLSIALFSTEGCYYDNEEDLFGADSSCDTTNVTYASDVAPIIINRCYVCHETGADGGGIVLSGYTNTKIWVDNGRLIGSIKHAAGFSPMPKSASKMPNCEINTIEAWIRNGAPDN